MVNDRFVIQKWCTVRFEKERIGCGGALAHNKRAAPVLLIDTASAAIRLQAILAAPIHEHYKIVPVMYCSCYVTVALCLDWDAYGVGVWCLISFTAF